jgi:signal transduction histidine kinase/tetratricopeptide (TPR) repeat protein
MKYLNSIILGLLLGCIALLYTFEAFSQSSAIKPTKQTALKDSIKKLDSLIQLNLISNPVLCTKNAQKALNYAHILKTSEELIHGYSLMGQAFYRKDKDSSFIYFNKAIKLADSVKNISQKPLIQFNLGILSYSARDYKTAIIYLDSCIKLADSLKDYSIMSQAFNALGNINIDIKNKEVALKMYDSANKIAVRHSISKQIGITLGNLARFEKDPDKALKLQRKAISYLIKTKGSEEGLAKIYINIGYNAKNPDTALLYFRKALKLTQNNNLKEVELGAYNNMVYSYLDKGDVKSAEACLVDHAIPLAMKENNDDWMSTLCDSYAEVLVRKGEFKAAAKWQKTALDKRVTAYRTQASEQVRLLGVLLDLKSKELTIHDNQKKLLLQQNRLQKLRLGLAITVLMIIGFIFIILWLQQRNRLKLQHQQIRSAKRIIEIEENEKAKVARELHDITGQLVLGITGEIESLDLPETKIKEEIKGKINVLGQSIRLISHRMNKAMLDNFTFKELIEGQCEDIRKATGLQIRLEMPEEPIILNEESVLHAYRIVQELLTNAGKYARDSYVNLSFRKTGAEIIISYFDNGQGFDPDLIEKKGMGLINIFERAKLLNGSAKVVSAPGDGTSWEIKFPWIPEKAKTG